MTIFCDARHYNKNSPVQAAEAGYLIDKLHCDFHDKKLLDIGCGDGKISAFMHSLGAEVTGIDLSESMIEFARHNFPECTFLPLHAEHVASLPENYDLITSFNCLHWVDDLPEALSGARSRMKSEGVFLGLIYPRCEALWAAAEWVETLPEYAGTRFSNPYHFYTQADMQSMLTTAGFSQVELWEESKQARFEDQDKYKDYIAGWLPHCAYFRPGFIDDWFTRYMEITGQTGSQVVTMDYDIIFFIAS